MILNFEIVHQNEDFLVINKPAGLSFHNDREQSGTFTRLTQQLGYNLWPVHRLDKITSGILLFAKKREVATQLGKMFEQKEIQKVYYAISDKKPKKKQGKIIGDIQKSRGGSWKLLKSRLNPAITRFNSLSLIPGKRIFRIEPTTGKTHQIRVALKSQGSPIIGDQRYGGTAADRAYLHAYSISFLWQGQQVLFYCQPSEGELFLLPQVKLSIEKFEH